MSKIYLKLRWDNHVLVSRPNGVKTFRDETYTEICEAEDLLSKVLARVRRKGLDTDSEYKRFWAAVKKVERDNCKVPVTVSCNNEQGKSRKMFTYTIAPVKLQFDVDGCTYIVKKDKGLVRVSGKLKAPTGESGLTYSGMSDKAAKANGVVRSHMSKEDSDAYIKDKVEARTAAIIAEREGKEDAPPFSTVPQSGMQKPKGKAAKKKPKALWDNSAQSDTDKPKGDEKPRVAVDKPAPKLSKKQQQECDKFKLDVANLPADKPKGMNKRIWAAINQAAVIL